VQAGIGGFLLKPWNERSRTQMQILPEVQANWRIPGLQIFGFNLPSLPGTGEGLPFQFVINTANDYELLLQVADRIKRAMESGKFAFVDLDLAFDKPEWWSISTAPRRRRWACRCRTSAAHWRPAGRGGNQPLHHRRPQLQGDCPGRTAVPRQPRLAEQLLREERPGRAAAAVDPDHPQRPRPAAPAQPVPATQFGDHPGVPLVSMGEAIDTVLQIARKKRRRASPSTMPAPRQYVQEGSALWVTFALALAIIFLVLAAQFESFRDPLVILVTVPLSICGALIPLFLGWSSMNIYTQVGLVTLIGLISKHGILIVEFANQLRKDKGLTRAKRSRKPRQSACGRC
jgi:multidrug efflux pump